MAGVDDVYTKALLHFNGADASTTITDESGKAWTARGSAQLDTAQKKFGASSLLCDGVDSYVDTPDHDDFDFGSGNFSVDFWVRFNAKDKFQGFYEQFTDANNYYAFYMNSLNAIRFYAISGGVTKANYGYSWTFNLNQWYHIALVRSTTTLYLFIGGINTAWTDTTTAISTNTLPNSTGNFRFGYHSFDGGTTKLLLDGWGDELRISKGIARWTSDFTPPIIEYVSFLSITDFHTILRGAYRGVMRGVI